MNETINIPIQATYRCTKDSVVKIEETRADVPVSAIADLLAQHFGLEKAVSD